MAEVCNSADKINQRFPNLMLGQTPDVVTAAEGIEIELNGRLMNDDLQEYAYHAVSEMGVSEEIQDLIFMRQLEGQIKCLIDDVSRSRSSVAGSGKAGGEAKKGVCKPEEAEKKRGKRTRRRGRRARKDEECLNFVDSVSCEVREKKGLLYSRTEMEAMRFDELENQKKKWIEVYCGLCPLVAREYDGLVDSVNLRRNNNEDANFDFDPRLRFRKDSTPPVSVAEDSLQLPEYTRQHISPSDFTNFISVTDEISYSTAESEYSPDAFSDEDYSSIQKPAFLVTGEPDFDSGPPQDGLEFLRRVRWEAAQIPEVTIAKIEKGNMKKEQTTYMPQLPDIMKCPENLLPLKEWEDSFVADFSELRLGFSQLDLQGDYGIDSVKFQSILVENFYNSTSGDEACPSEDSSSMHTCEKSDSTTDLPNLSSILEMEPATRTSMLKSRISSMENANTLLRHDCLWLFSLLVAVDVPLDADTSAALRSLLRKCASLRASKENVDEQVIVLNIFAAISGRYFGQLEK